MNIKHYIYKLFRYIPYSIQKILFKHWVPEGCYCYKHTGRVGESTFIHGDGRIETYTRPETRPCPFYYTGQIDYNSVPDYPAETVIEHGCYGCYLCCNINSEEDLEENFLLCDQVKECGINGFIDEDALF